MKILVIALLVSFSSIISASDNIRAKVIYAGVTGAGTVFVHVTNSINEPNCTSNSLWIDPSTSDSIKNQILSTALAAFAAQKDVYIKASGCYDNFPTLDNTNNSWIHIYPAE